MDEALNRFREAKRAADAAYDHHQRTRTAASACALREADGAQRAAELAYEAAVEAQHFADNRAWRERQAVAA